VNQTEQKIQELIQNVIDELSKTGMKANGNITKTQKSATAIINAADTLLAITE